MLAAAPSWSATIVICAPLASIAVWLLIPLLRETGESRPSRGVPLPLVVFGGVPVAVATVVVFMRVASHDYRLEPDELGVISAATGAIALLMAVDLVRYARWRRLPSG